MAVNREEKVDWLVDVWGVLPHQSREARQVPDFPLRE
jgi:hypothetical protein